MAFLISAHSRRQRLLVVLLALLASGCDVYDASLVAPAVQGVVPARPPASTSSPDDKETVVFGFHGVDLEQTGTAAKTGLDLDGINTQPPDNVVECNSKYDPRDGDNGIDNKMGTALLPGILTGNLSTLNCELEVSFRRGHGTIMLRIDKWNGEPNDSSVTATVVSAVDATSVDPSEVAGLNWNGKDLLLANGDPAPDPCWLDADCATPSQFYVNKRAYLGGDTSAPNLVQPAAYIVDNTLVMQVTSKRFELMMDARYVPITLSTGYILAKMNEDHTEITAGLLAGRFPVNDLKVIGPPIGVCDNALSEIYPAFADILATPREAGEPPTAQFDCDAISTGISFLGTAVTWQGFAPVQWDPPEWCDLEPPPPAECCSGPLAPDNLPESCSP